MITEKGREGKSKEDIEREEDFAAMDRILAKVRSK